ncbi:hypothetical protein B0T24DRAFT_275442 [Lasiosphaeria ovina]|uniref:ATP-dependent DNA ligase family profile domain-containing protein n=1 Tax=Lasiosphaeria ovina TaxID=92902 RepID=A0AAE0N7P2_9PEZI|nr:hypothetical protein B0T24DRAFT_275442 [Lasiosphaeria ovina]
MPFPFAYICNLLQGLEDNQHAQVGQKTNASIIQAWFRSHQAELSRDDHDPAALLSALLPEKRTDRVYSIREKKLQIIIGRALILGISRKKELERWAVTGSGVDLADCVYGILCATPNPQFPDDAGVTIEEIDGLLHSIASECRYSSPAVRTTPSGTRFADTELALGGLYKRLLARDAKWLTRLILKNYEPVVLDPSTVYSSYHPYLSTILKVQDDFTIAGRIIVRQRRERTVTSRADTTEYLKPALGVKVGRQNWIKGRSIKHCLDMSRGRMSCEDKVDGEYCQIHIDLSKDSKGGKCIQIFSKSGKDSTDGRIALHDSIRRSLQLGQPSCPLKSGCILEGELVVFSDKDAKILDFHKIRKHVSRSGSFLGTDQDSQRHPWEHLMIIYYDLLMVDGESLLGVRHSERFKRLKDLVTLVPGRSALVKRELIDCSSRSAASDLRRAFAKCITAHGEGLVLKPDDPYFTFGARTKPYSSCAIKLKKEYVGHFGDIGDVAVVGARYDPAKAKTYGIPNLKWTHFYVGCLENKDEVVRFQKTPRFIVTNVVELNASQMTLFVKFVNPQFVAPGENKSISIRVEPGVDNGNTPSVIFPAPPVFDLRCFSFDKVGNTSFWSPRFPMVNKIHCDRTYRNTLSFTELQDMALEEREMPPPEDSQELLGWIAALEAADPKCIAVDHSSQMTVASTLIATTPSTQSTDSVQAGSSASSHLQTSPAPVRGRAGDPPTPPRPSTVQAGHEPRTNNSRGVQDTPKRQKRPPESSDLEHQGKTKVRKFQDERRPTVGDWLSQSMSEIQGTPRNRREPLSDVGISSSRRNNLPSSTAPRLTSTTSMYQLGWDNARLGAPERVQNSLPVSLSFQGLLAPHLSITSSTVTGATNARDSNGDHDNISPEEPSTSCGKCRFLDSCKLSKCSFLLSPCIANFPWVTEDLLVCHGVADIVLDYKELTTAQPSCGTTPATVERTRKKRSAKRKVILVESRRKDPTAAFMKLVTEAKEKRPSNDREYFEVYDWRILEALRYEEAKCSRNGKIRGACVSTTTTKDIEKKFRLGLV